MNAPEDKQEKIKPAVLVIDDNPVNLRSAKVFLEARFEVIPVKSGLEGLDVLKKRTVDIILLDIEMPMMDGFTFLLRLKEIPDKADIPVICVTAHDATPNFVGSVIKAGASGYISKPFTPAVLNSKVLRTLNLNEFVL